MDCTEQIYSNDYYDFIIGYENIQRPEIDDYCKQTVNWEYNIIFAPASSSPPLNVDNYTYTAIPKCYTLMDQTALEVTGILKVQNQPTLSLKGQGVLVGFVDTGIGYQNPVFQNSDGSTRIISIWDQTIRGKPPEGFLYGTEYTQEEINQALLSSEPLEVVPSTDEDGHGTFVAGVAAGSSDYNKDFVGAAPYADIVVVKLKGAKQYIRDFYYIPDGAVAYEETDIMTGVSYIWKLAEKLNKPFVICIALGTNMGNHKGNSPLSSFLSYLGTKRGSAIVSAAGNEANSRHHFMGNVQLGMEYENVEVNVGEDVIGFTMEFWAAAPELYAITIISPTGEKVPRIPAKEGERIVYRFIFEQTEVSIDYRIVGTRTGDQLIYVRFDKPTRGLWHIQVYGVSRLTGNYDIWLPVSTFLSGDVFFLRSNPDTTVTAPSNATVPMTVGAYDARDGSLYINSGRGYTFSDIIKPDFVAPGVNVYGPNIRNQYVTLTGTSASAAITAGASALFLEWAIINENNPTVNSTEVKNYFIRGAKRSPNIQYPNKEWGYGILDLYETFQALRSN